MNSLTPHVSRRTIGDVSIFDLFGTIESNWIDGVKSYIESYIHECNLSLVILNIQPIEKVKAKNAYEILNVLKIPKKAAIYYDTPEIRDQFLEGHTENDVKLCNSTQSIIEIFGKHLIERDKVIHFNERRQFIRMKTALSCSIDFIDKQGEKIHSSALVTNLCSNGLFAEYLDLDSALQVENLDYFKNLTLQIKMQNPNNLSDEFITKSGKIIRIEFSGTQTGIAVHY